MIPHPASRGLPLSLAGHGRGVLTQDAQSKWIGKDATPFQDRMGDAVSGRGQDRPAWLHQLRNKAYQNGGNASPVGSAAKQMSGAGCGWIVVNPTLGLLMGWSAAVTRQQRGIRGEQRRRPMDCGGGGGGGGRQPGTIAKLSGMTPHLRFAGFTSDESSSAWGVRYFFG